MGINCNYLERPQFQVVLDSLVGELTAHQTLGVEDRVLGVGSELILRGITNQALASFGCKGHIGRSDSVLKLER
jgi:hypothetical protein